MLAWLALALLVTGCGVILPTESAEQNECWRMTSGTNTGATIWQCVGAEASAACAADVNRCAEYER